MPQSDTTYMQLSQQELLTPSQARSLLERNIPMVGYSLSKRGDLPKSIKLKAIKLYSQILDLNSNHKNKQEIGTLIGKNTNDWVLLTKELEIDNLFLLTLAIESTDGDIKLHEIFMKTLESVDNSIVNKGPSLLNVDNTNPRFVQVNNFYHYEDLTPTQSHYLREVPEEKACQPQRVSRVKRSHKTRGWSSRAQRWRAWRGLRNSAPVALASLARRAGAAARGASCTCSWNASAARRPTSRCSCFDGPRASGCRRRCARVPIASSIRKRNRQLR